MSNNKGIIEYRGKKIKWYIVQLSKTNMVIIYRSKLTDLKIINIKYNSSLDKDMLCKILKNSIDKGIIFGDSWKKLTIGSNIIKWKLKKHVDDTNIYRFKIRDNGTYNIIINKDKNNKYKYTELVNEIESICRAKYE